MRAYWQAIVGWAAEPAQRQDAGRAGGHRGPPHRTIPLQGRDWVLLGSVSVLAAAELAILNHWAFGHLAAHDGGIIIYGAERIVSGQAPYRDFFHFFAPGSVALLAGLYLVAGMQVWTTLLAVALLAAGIAVSAAVLGRTVGLPRAWAAFAAWLAVNAGIIWWPTPSHHWFATAPMLAGVAAAVRAVETGSVRWAAAAGGLLAAACWFHQARGAVLALAVGASLLAYRPRAFKPLLAGAAAAALPLPALLALVPATSVWQSVVVYPLTRYPTDWISFMALGLFPSAPLVDAWRKQLQVLAQVGFLWLALPALLLALALAVHQRQRGAAVAAIAGIAGYVSVLYWPSAAHFTFAAPLFAVPLVWLALRAARRWPLARALAVVLALAHLLVLAPLHEAVLVATGRTVAVPTPRGPAPIGTGDDAAAAAGTLEPVAQYVLTRTAPGEPVFTFPTKAIYYFLLGRPNATRHDYLLAGENPLEHFAEVASDLERVRPRLVIVDHGVADRHLQAGPSEGRASYELLNATLERLYRSALRAGYLEVLEAR